MLALLALAVLSPSPHDVGAPTATPDAIRPRVAVSRVFNPSIRIPHLAGWLESPPAC